MSDESPHVHPPRQERSRRTLERLVEAARSLAAEEGIEAVTVARVVERAGSSVGSFYARFDGKDDLLRYLEERVWRTAAERWEEALELRDWDDLDLAGVVRSLVQFLVRIQVEDAADRSALGRGVPPGVLEGEAQRFHARLEREVAELVLQRRSAVRHPEPEKAAHVAYRWAVGGIRELLDSFGGSPSDPEMVSEEVARGLTAYLGGGAAASEDREGVEFFDVWQ